MESVPGLLPRSVGPVVGQTFVVWAQVQDDALRPKHACQKQLHANVSHISAATMSRTPHSFYAETCPQSLAGYLVAVLRG